MRLVLLALALTACGGTRASDRAPAAAPAPAPASAPAPAPTPVPAPTTASVAYRSETPVEHTGLRVASDDALQFSGDKVNRIIYASTGRLRTCYQRVLEVHPDLSGVSGKVVIAFTITTTGQTTDVLVHSTTLDDPTLESCVVSVIQQLEFPRSGQPTPVKYPFLFSGG
jgi:outer membrane biosynthesis protein TonB